MTKRKKVSIRRFIPIVLLIPSLILNIFLLFRNKAVSSAGVPVIGVIDGDTIVLEGMVW